MTTENTQTETTNGHDAATLAPTPSPLIAIRAAFEKAGGKVDSKAALKARDAYLATNAKVKDAENALQTAQKANQASARDLMVATGAQPLRFGGVMYNPSSRGEVVFYRPASTKEVLELK